jgi:cytochrome c-type biogenesis protein CcmH
VNAWVAIAALLLAGAAAAAKVDPVPVAPSGADSPGMTALDLRLKRLESELRCLVCQNQTLADSNADLAEDLRREVRELALAGKTDAEIKTYLVTRYGDFVLYDPPLKAVTSVLWLGPFALLVGGTFVWWLVLRRRKRGAGAEAPPPTAADKASETRARKLLDDEDDAPE